jgi:hypothetical protein
MGFILWKPGCDGQFFKLDLSAPRGPLQNLSQTRSAIVSKEITACLKRGAEMSPSVLNEITDTAP